MRGNLQLLQGAGVSLVALVVILAIGSQLIGEVAEAVHTYETHTETNETFSGVAYNVPNSFALTPFNQSRATATAILVIWNSTTNEVESTSYSFTNLTWTVTNQSMENDTEYYVHYTYRVDVATMAYNLSSDGLYGLSEFSDWLSIIAIVLIAGAILGMLMVARGAFGGRE